MDKKVFSFNEINQKYQEEEREKKIDLEIERDAKDLFSKALFSLSKDDARKYAREAYELRNDMYEYKTFLISLEENEKIKLSEYKKLYEEVNKLIESDSLIKIYDRTEYKKERYNNLKISYINSLIKNRNYDEALIFLKEYENVKNIYKYHTKHLIMNILLFNKEYEEVVNLYNMESDESVLILIPLSLAYLHMSKYKNFVDVVRKIYNINKNIKKIDSLDEEKIKFAKEKYKIGSMEEIYFAFKDFYFLYKNDSDYILKVVAILK